MSSLHPQTVTTLSLAVATARVGGYTPAAWTETTPQTIKRCVMCVKPWSPWQQGALCFDGLGFGLTSARVCGSAQLYEQILAENEKLKAQLRDTDLELADLKLQLEKATQVEAARASPPLPSPPPSPTLLCCRFRGRSATLTDLSWRWRKG